MAKRKYPLTLRRVLAAIEESHSGLENPGFCLACGADADGCEPDAEGYRCEECGVFAVMGAENVLLHLA